MATAFFQLLVAGLVVLVAVLLVPWHAPSLAPPGAADMGAYLAAAQRLQEGAPLYVTFGTKADDVMAYRYAPWLAFVFVPFTHIPVELADLVWTSSLLMAAGYLMSPLWQFRHRLEAWVLAGLVGVGMARAVMAGNVHTLAVAAVAFGITRRSGPAWIALASTVKPSGLAFVTVYIARREWWRAAVTLGLSALLWAPTMAFDLSDFPSRGFGAAWIAIAGVAMILTITLALKRSRWGTLSAAVAASLGTGRLHPYALSWIVTPLRRDRRSGPHEPFGPSADELRA